MSKSKPPLSSAGQIRKHLDGYLVIIRGFASDRIFDDKYCVRYEVEDFISGRRFDISSMDLEYGHLTEMEAIAFIASLADEENKDAAAG